MSRGVYELIALAARYGFTALMALIVLRALRITLVDARRASQLRRMLPETGVCGELIVIEGEKKARRGMKYPVIREGMIGASRRADIRIRHSSVHRRHAYFQYVDGRLRLQAHTGAPLTDGRGMNVRELSLDDGARFSVGRIKLMLVLSEAVEPAHLHPGHRRPERRERPGVAEPPEDLFETHPLFQNRPERRREQPMDADRLFETHDDNLWENPDE